MFYLFQVLHGNFEACERILEDACDSKLVCCCFVAARFTCVIFTGFHRSQLIALFPTELAASQKR